ncbi:hypothetical protein HT031_006600 [Scenedesmus sp. PABB004]|nr:hypothetical protein HT031_006600 [Scenedesmus sp. PABB004]
MRVRRCHVKAWPRSGARRAGRRCGGLALSATVSDVNRATNGTLVLPALPSGALRALRATLEFVRADEQAVLSLEGGCELRFAAQTATDATLGPLPGDEGAAASTLPWLLLPALAAPVAAAGVIVALGRAAARRDGEGGADYAALAPGPPADDGGGGSGGDGGGLISRTFNLRAMTRRAKARRLRRAARPQYVGAPEGWPAQQQLYSEGRLEPAGHLNLVAPCFRFPPVAAPPGLPDIPECGLSGANTPCGGSSALPSRAGSTTGELAALEAPGSPVGGDSDGAGAWLASAR